MSLPPDSGPPPQSSPERHNLGFLTLALLCGTPWLLVGLLWTIAVVYSTPEYHGISDTSQALSATVLVALLHTLIVIWLPGAAAAGVLWAAATQLGGWPTLSLQCITRLLIYFAMAAFFAGGLFGFYLGVANSFGAAMLMEHGALSIPADVSKEVYLDGQMSEWTLSGLSLSLCFFNLSAVLSILYLRHRKARAPLGRNHPDSG